MKYWQLEKDPLKTKLRTQLLYKELHFYKFIEVCKFAE